MVASKRVTGLPSLPMELLLDIYHHMDVGSIYELSGINKFFHNLFTTRKAAILFPVLAREFSPFDELLQVYTASANDLPSTARSLYQPRRIILRRFTGDAGIVLADGPSAAQTKPVYTQVNGRGRGERSDADFRGHGHIVLTGKDLGPILELCLLVRKWESLFPSMRWYYDPARCRTLRPHEGERFRRAFYRWWLFGIYFHGDMPRPRVGLPEPFADDFRSSLIRHYPTSELLELMDLMETLKDIILHYICPRLNANEQLNLNEQPPLIDSVDRMQSMSDSWNDQSRWGRVIKTYFKLGPRDLMYYFDNICSYPRRRLIGEIRAKFATFTFDQESMQLTVRCVLDERQWLVNSPSLATDESGGIIDFDDERDLERSVFDKDGSHDGGLPNGKRFVTCLSQYSPRGDDGAHLEDYDRESAWERLHSSFQTLPVESVMP